MAQFALQSDDSIHNLAQTPGTIIEKPHLPDVEVRIDKADGGYLDQLEDLKKQMERDEDPVIAAPAAVIDIGRALTHAESLRLPVQEARRLIRQEKYEEALEVLREALTGPGDDAAEAIYLGAFCLVHLDRLEEALEMLGPLSAIEPEPALAGPIADLKGQIRGRMLPPVVIENALLVRAGRVDQAVDRLRRLTRLDPGSGLYHFMLAGNLLTAERPEAALAAADRGLAESEPGGRQQLEGLRRQIEMRLLETMMAPARRHYRRGNYPRARSALKKVDERYRHNPLWVTFHRYLEELGGSLGGLLRGKTAAQVRPAGRFADVDALHFFLVREEVAEAKALLAVDRVDQAGGVLEQALAYTPHFPYAHFLRAICLYRQVLHALAGGRFPGPAAAREILETALAHARTGAEDDDITETGSLISTLEGAIEGMRELERVLEVHAREGERVNAVIARYQAAMKAVGDGISSPEQWRRARGVMRELRPEIRKVEAAIQRPDGKEALAHLAEVVERNLEQLDGMKDAIAEADKVQELMTEFQGVMSSAQSGISSLAEAGSLARRLAALKKKITAARRRVRGKEGKEALDQLTAAVDRNASQLADIQRQARETPKYVAELNALTEEFNRLMSSVQGGIGSRSQLESFQQDMVALGAKVNTLKDTIPDPAGKKAAQDLWNAVANVVRQTLQA